MSRRCWNGFCRTMESTSRSRSPSRRRRRHCSYRVRPGCRVDLLSRYLELQIWPCRGLVDDGVHYVSFYVEHCMGHLHISYALCLNIHPQSPSGTIIRLARLVSVAVHPHTSPLLSWSCRYSSKESGGGSAGGTAARGWLRYQPHGGRNEGEGMWSVFLHFSYHGERYYRSRHEKDQLTAGGGSVERDEKALTARPFIDKHCLKGITGVIISFL